MGLTVDVLDRMAESARKGPGVVGIDRDQFLELVEMAKAPKRPSSIFAVVYGNYYPREVNTIHWTRESADAEAREEGGEWEVIEWVVS